MLGHYNMSIYILFTQKVITIKTLLLLLQREVLGIIKIDFQLDTNVDME